MGNQELNLKRRAEPHSAAKTWPPPRSLAPGDRGLKKTPPLSADPKCTNFGANSPAKVTKTRQKPAFSVIFVHFAERESSWSRTLRSKPSCWSKTIHDTLHATAQSSRPECRFARKSATRTRQKIRCGQNKTLLTADDWDPRRVSDKKAES